VEEDIKITKAKATKIEVTVGVAKKVMVEAVEITIMPPHTYPQLNGMR
jgi:hypothetical protein